MRVNSSVPICLAAISLEAVTVGLLLPDIVHKRRVAIFKLAGLTGRLPMSGQNGWKFSGTVFGGSIRALLICFLSKMFG